MQAAIPGSPVKAGGPAAAAAANVKGKPVAGEQLTAGPYAVNPSKGTLAPGEKQSLSITFTPAAAQSFEERLVLDFSDR